MKINREFLEKEIDKANKILDEVGYEARIEEDSDGPYIGLLDVQGAGSVEPDEKFYRAHDIMKRLEGYYEDAFLDGEICCDMHGVTFVSFDEAEFMARKRGYREEADMIAYYMRLLAEPDTETVTEPSGEKVLTPKKVSVTD